MSSFLIGGLGVLGLLVMLALRAPLGLALLITGFGGLWQLHGLDTAIYVVSTAPVTALSSHTLSVLPLFIFMGALSVRAGFAEGLYRAAFGFVGHRPGGLATASIAGLRWLRRDLRFQPGHGHDHGPDRRARDASLWL